MDVSAAAYLCILYGLIKLFVFNAIKRLLLIIPMQEASIFFFILNRRICYFRSGFPFSFSFFFCNAWERILAVTVVQQTFIYFFLSYLLFPQWVSVFFCCFFFPMQGKFLSCNNSVGNIFFFHFLIAIRHSRSEFSYFFLW